jgi:hypothetical protein
MRIIWRLLGQQPDLRGLERLSFSPGVEQGPRPGDRRDSYQREVARELPGPPEAAGPFRWLQRAILAYEVFPTWLVSGVVRRAPLAAGDTYGICYHVLPGLDLFFGGRVTETFDGPEGDTWRAGFIFQTLRGHPELGEETFWVEKELATGVIRAGLRSWSRPGMWLTRVVAPLARWIQVRACHAAMDQYSRVAALASGVMPMST